MLAAAAIAGCDIDTDFAEELVEKTAERNQRRLLEQQRAELPLPDPARVPYRTLTAADIELDDDFRVELIDDLVLGEGRSEPEYLFVRFSGRSAALGNVDVDTHGRIWVLETRSAQVRVFDPAGAFLYAFGQRGQGPGDFEGPYGLKVAGDRVHVLHRRYNASIWTLGGDFVRDREILRTPEALAAVRLLEAAEGTSPTSPSEARARSVARTVRAPVQMIGRPDGSMIMVVRSAPEEHTGRVATPYVRIVGRYEDGVDVQRYIEIPEWATPSVAVAPEGGLYVGMFGHLRSEHFVVALDAEGAARWVLSTPWDADIAPRADLRVDGQGRLYVLPNFQPVEDDPRSPVQVYTPAGELIGSGYVNRRPLWTHWQVTHGEHVYGVRLDPVSEEWQVVRYRVEVSSS